MAAKLKIKSEEVLLVSKGELKAKMFEYLRLVENTGKSLEVTNRGIVTCKITPLKQKRVVSDIFAKYQGQIRGDILGSENEEWGELS